MTNIFDAYTAYYDLLYIDKDYVGESQYVYDLLARQGVAQGSILELGCGTGKHAEHLAGMGFSVHGVDISPTMVETANNQMPENLADQLQFEVGDVRTTRVDKKFDAVISLFHVVSYQTRNEDLAAIFETAKKHLQSGGVFVFDFWHGPGVLSEPPSVRVKRMASSEVDVLRIAEPERRCGDNVVDVNYTVMVSRKDKDGVEHFKENHPMRYLFLPEINYFLNNSGLELVNSYAWMSKYEPDFKDWLAVVVCKKI